MCHSKSACKLLEIDMGFKLRLRMAGFSSFLTHAFSKHPLDDKVEILKDEDTPLRLIHSKR